MRITSAWLAGYADGVTVGLTERLTRLRVRRHRMSVLDREGRRATSSKDAQAEQKPSTNKCKTDMVQRKSFRS